MATSIALDRRPCQVRHNEQLFPAIESGSRRICITSPTGSGKTRMQIDTLEWARTAALFTYKTILRDQIASTLEREGVNFGMRASGSETALLRDIQLCMTQTELSRVYRRKDRALHECAVVVIDEAHNQASGGMEQIMADYEAAGTALVGYTATPLDIGHLYSELIIAGTVKECLQRRELVPAVVYAPDEPDLKHIKKYKIGDDLTEKQNNSAIMREGIFGRVITHYHQINPEQRPTILFAPGVPESVWFAQEFNKAGIRAASIDGDNVWLDGELYESNRLMRDRVAELSQSGEVKVVCNRYVLREGVDWPWLAHGIFATVFGSLTSYIQSAGRLLRCYPGLDHVTLQDHGGNYHRHGPVDVDRNWSLELTNHIACGLRERKLREKEISEPITCPKCHAVRWSGNKCNQCGHIANARTRMVVQIDGQLRERTGDIYKPRRVKREADTLRKWEHYYHVAKNSKNKMTFNQAVGFFAYENWYWPPNDLPRMPIDPIDWFRSVCDVPKERLR
jgi:superfamily II DNA or RNA helicase